GAYAQDEISVSPSFKFTIGVRMDKPVYPEQPLENPATKALSFTNLNGETIHYNGKWPKATPLFSPRVGFRWDVYGDKNLVIRGGTGLFTGRIPFVYLTNIPTNSGMYQFSAKVLSTSAGVDMSDFLFNPDPHAYNPYFNTALATKYPAYFPTTAGTLPSTNIVFTEPDYKFPQVWKTDLAFDQQIAKTWKVSVEALYTKDINATFMYDANQKAPDSKVTTGSYTRGYYSSTSASVRRINPSITNAIVLANTHKGSSFVFTTQIEKTFSKGLYGALAYTYNYAANITENPGSQAASTYNANVTGGTLNDFELAYTNFAVPHRIIGFIGYRVEYLQHLGTTVSLIYEGAANGTYSYVYSGSLNNQGQNSANLMYIPTDATNPAEIKFKDVTYSTAGLVTAAQQAQIFEKYIKQDPYLSKHRGQIAERNGAKRPWYNRVDMKILQDIFSKFGSRRHTVQLSADIYNLTNLINHNWGARKIYTINNPLKVESVTNGIPTFSITSYNGAPVSQTFINTISTSSTWSVQLGIRYSF
ncbi:MAG TPA: hypothetical protein VFP87_05260, partial [Chitinophagaceae bacterium]|nr:hypothetical protein [Chitinophagaceae bacterium]